MSFKRSVSLSNRNILTASDSDFRTASSRSQYDEPVEGGDCVTPPTTVQSQKSWATHCSKPSTKSNAQVETSSESDLEEARLSSLYEPNRPPRRPRLADVVDTLNGQDVGASLRRSSVIQSAVRAREASSLPDFSSEATTTISRHSGRMDLVGPETQKRLSSMKSSSSSGMSKWRYPKDKSFIVDMNNPPSYAASKNVSFEVKKPQTPDTSMTSTPPSISDPLPQLKRPDPPPKDPPLDPNPNVYFPVTSPLRPKPATEKFKGPNKKVIAVAIGCLLLLGLILYFALLGEVVSIGNTLSRVRDRVFTTSTPKPCLVDDVVTDTKLAAQNSPENATLPE